MIVRTTTQFGLLMLISIVLVGCGSDDAEVSPAELLRRKQLRESRQLSKSKTPQQRLRDAREFYQAGNMIDAQQTLRPLLIADPQNPEIILLAAQCYHREGDVTAAVNMLDSMPPADVAAYSEALWLAAKWLADNNQFDAAQQRLEKILQLQGDFNRVYHKLVSLLNIQGRRIEAAKYLHALARSGDISEKELIAMNTLGNMFIDESVPRPNFGGRLVKAELAQAKLFRSDGELQRARQLTERLNQAFPESTQISAFLGRIYSDLREDEPLRQWLDNTPEGIQGEPEYWFALASWLQRQSRHREAVRCFAEAVLRDQTDLFSYLGLASSLTFLGQQQAAERVQQRYQLLAEAARIATLLGKQVGSRQQLNRMADILDQLQRPWEAVAWRSVALKTHGGAEQEIEAIKQRREELATQQTDPTAEFLVCGIDLAKWPLPSQQQLGTSLADKASLPSDTMPVVPLVLTNVAADVGLEFQYVNGDDPSDDETLLHQLTGGGIGVIDLDLDGWPDLYLTQGGGDAYDADGSQPNQMFRNLNGRRFVDITSGSRTGDRGYAQGAAVADLNQDGFADLVVANIGANVVYRNNGDGTFAREVLEVADDNGGWTTSIACGDLSGDHLPEIVEVNYIDDKTAMEITCTPESDACKPSVFQAALDRVRQVNATGGIEFWGGCEEMDAKPNYGFAAVIANFDQQAGNDLFIANDTERNHFWVSQQNDQVRPYALTESAQIRGCSSGMLGLRQGCMGIAQGDFDRDGSLDLHVTNYWTQPANLYLQQSPGFFVDGSAKRGIYEATRMTVAWGTQAVDFDRNGWLDLAVLNGHVTNHLRLGEPYKMRPQLFRGAAEGFEFVAPSEIGDDYWALPTLGRTMATLDFNRDGKPDLVTNHLDVPAALLENRTQAGHSVQFELVGCDSERDAVGAKIVVTCGDQSWTGWAIGGDGLLCSNEQVIDVGIGAAGVIDRVEVTWPSGKTQQFGELPPDARYLITEGDPEVFSRISP